MSDKEGKEDEVDAVVIVTGTSQDVGGVGFVLHVWGGWVHQAESDKEEDANVDRVSSPARPARLEFI
jgi:hypothetical protein